MPITTSPPAPSSSYLAALVDRIGELLEFARRLGYGQTMLLG